jgi:predicted nucleotidyltransferase
MIGQDTIDAIKNKLINFYNPVEIYLFGSYVWGKPDAESDLDLLIIVDSCMPQDRYKAMAEGHRALLDFRNVGKDILVLTKKEFDTISDDKTRMFYKIKREGKKIYARA